MPNSFNASIGTELASLRALGKVRRRLSARDRLIRERRESAIARQKSQAEVTPAEEWGADD